MRVDVHPLKVSVIIPVYNSASALGELFERLHSTLAAHAVAWEVIFVNDSSRDNSWDVISRLADRYPEVHGINLMRNYGQHNTLLCGIRAAQYDVIVTIDDDLQHPPEQIPHVLEKFNEGYDVVYGVPRKGNHGLLRDMASQITKMALQSTMGVDTARSVSAFRVFKTSIRDAFANYNDSYVSIDVLLTWGASRFGSIFVDHQDRPYGQSNYTVGKLIRHALNMITGFSTLPLQFASMIGFGFTVFGVCVLIYVVGRFLIEGGSVPGFPFLASIVAIFSGAQLFALGIIGEYIARMHFRLMARPAYAVRERIDRYLDSEADES